MRVARILILITLSLILCGRAARCETTPAELQQSIVDGVKMLEGKQYGPFLKRFVAPADREKMPIDDQAFIDNFAADKAPALLKVLKYIQTQSPTLSEDGAVATFALDHIPDGPNDRPIIFRKYDDGKWYINN